jgi:hypothetical protein
MHGHLRVWPYVGGIKPKLSPVEVLGKLFFRHHAVWEQRHKTIVLVWSVMTGLVLAGAFTGAMLAYNAHH